MFSQKRKNYGWIWAILICFIVILSVIIALTAVRNTESSDSQSSEQSETPASTQLPQNSIEKSSENKDIINDNSSSYYLIKYDDEAVKIMFYDKEGTEVELETTSIVFDTLSEEDQKKFRNGIKADTCEELNRIIMDYES